MLWYDPGFDTWFGKWNRKSDNIISNILGKFEVAVGRSAKIKVLKFLLQFHLKPVFTLLHNFRLEWYKILERLVPSIPIEYLRHPNEIVIYYILALIE